MRLAFAPGSLALLLVVLGSFGAAAAPAFGQDAPAAAPAVAQDAPAAPAPAPGVESAAHGEDTTPPFLIVPFVALLLLIATGPVLYPHHWHRHYHRYAVALGLLVAGYYVVGLGTGAPVVHALAEYVSFIALLGALYVAAGGILIQTDFAGTPRANTLVLAAGALLANLVGTTGASMLLIRPFLRLNAGRLRPYHVVFFIFVVSNPPLFLGFLRGVPFFWTLEHVWYIWAPTLVLLLGVFYVVDRRNRRVAARAVLPEEWLPEGVAGVDVDEPTAVPGPARVRLTGARNFGWLALIIACVFVDPNVLPGVVPDLHALHVPVGLREFLLLGIAYAAYRTGDRRALDGNGFSFEPIKEVAWLFVGIFLTMQPALRLIGGFARDHADGLGVSAFYFGTGLLSGVLDNAPTYVAFLAAAMAKFGLDVNSVEAVRAMATGAGAAGPDTWHYVQAISVAAVFWGALTYIGNGPNFMVKAIAEESGAETPSFFGYLFRYALPVLVPVFVLVWFVFFSGHVLALRGPVPPVFNP